MKGNVKKLALLVIIPCIVLFIMAAMASAGRFGPALWGEYAVTGGGACFAGPVDGFADVPDWIVLNASQTVFSPDVIEGTYTFYPNGKGVFVGTVRVLALADGTPLFGGSQEATWKFKYQVTRQGEIEFTDYETTGTWNSGPANGLQSCGDNGPTHGFISGDGDFLSVNCGPDPSRQIVIHNYTCDESKTRTGDLLCIISLTGHRR